MKITNYDLFQNKYNEIDLRNNIDNLNLKYIIDTQLLSVDFCNKYILNTTDIDDGSEESYLFDITHILKKQKHLKKCDFINCA